MTYKRKYTKAELIAAVSSSTSLRGVLIYLELKPAGGNYRSVRNQINNLGLSTKHWTRSRSGFTRKGKSSPRRSLSEILVENSDYTNTFLLGKRLQREGVLKSECYCCKNTEWRGTPLRFHLDHINGIGNDNRIENLRLLCPNCHSQTDTYCGNNIGGGPQRALALYEACGSIEKTAEALGVSVATARLRLSKAGVRFDLRRREHRTPEAKSRAENATKILWPPRADLERMVNSQPLRFISHVLKVSDVAIAKRCKKLGIKLPGRGYWAKTNKGKAHK